MGSGKSKLSPGEVVVPRTRPLRSHRLLELRRRKNGSNLKDGALLKKELLNGSEFEKDDSGEEEMKRNNVEKKMAEEKEEEEEGDDQWDDNDTDGNICPGSPSFRIFFMQPTENNTQNSVVVNLTETTSHKTAVSNLKPQRRDGGDHISFAKYSKKQEMKMRKKAKKGGSFKKAKSKSRTIAAKNLLNVKSCYHINFSGQDRARLLDRM